jgi:hypothetical protein
VYANFRGPIMYRTTTGCERNDFNEIVSTRAAQDQPVTTPIRLAKTMRACLQLMRAIVVVEEERGNVPTRFPAPRPSRLM